MNVMTMPPAEAQPMHRTEGRAAVSKLPCTLQTVLLPTPERADRTVLYARWAHGAAANADADGLRLPQDVTIDFRTFFNAFSAAKWADATGLERVAIELTGRGTVDLMICAFSGTGAGRPIVRARTALSEEGARIPLPALKILGCELIAFTLTAVDADAVLTGGRWVTDEPARRAVRIAAVVTTFRREAQAEAAIERFRREVIPASGGCVRLIVIDNGRTLAPLDEDGVAVIPNENLGGAGGFARGLIEATNRGWATHALFMDDDAACETESIMRAAAFAARLKDERTAISGAMLLEERPWVQHEKGARIGLGREDTRLWHTLGTGADLSDPAQVCAADGPDGANYGAFWFHLFPVAAVRHLPFPFFVRGDDIDFSLSNDFGIVTLNGIATWAPAFVTKQTAVTEYLSWRATLALFFTHGSRRMALRALAKCRKTAIRAGFRFDYAAMHAVAAAMDDVAKGPLHFMDHPAPLARLAETRAAAPSPERSFEIAEVRPLAAPRRTAWRRALVWITAGGYLLPRSRRDPFVRHVRDAWSVHPVQTMTANRLLFGEGLETRLHVRDGKAMLVGLRRVLSAFFRLRFAFRSVREDWQTHRDWPRSAAFWRRALKVEPRN